MHTIIDKDVADTRGFAITHMDCTIICEAPKIGPHALAMREKKLGATADKSAMKFGSEGGSKAKAWRDIWSAGQGVGNIDDVPSVRDLVLRMEKEYREASQRLYVA